MAGDKSTVTVVRTGAANLASVVAALARAGTSVRWAEGADDVERAERLILPGVGAFAAAMAELQRCGLVEALRARVENSRPTMAICLGLQLLFQGSAESPQTAGLGLFPGSAQRFSNEKRVPQLGWNEVVPQDQWVEPAHAYYANSYFIETPPAGFHVAYSHYGSQRMVGAMGRESVLACQFHPELSGPWGQALIERWLKGGWPC